MIPHGRPVMTEADIAEAAGLELHTWRRRHGADFRAKVSVTNPGDRLRLYDAAQARAYLEGRPIPTRPEADPHPEDLLSVDEVADLLGTDASTVRAYAVTGYLAQGIERHGRRWWPRHVAQERLDAGDQRYHPELTGAGRKPGDPRNRAPRGRQPRTDARVREVAAALAQAEAEGRMVTADDLADRYEVSRRTGERLLAAAKEAQGKK
jgi:hypothetical protein